jgi:tRNA threonylcarbamoyladenosine biosynthesis protein TsaB
MPLALPACFDDVDFMGQTKRILAIETSGRWGSVAVLQGDTGEARLLEQIALSGSERTAQSLAPALQRLLATVGWPPKSIEIVAVTMGPGSFTGLRIGATTAKTFAYVVGAEVVGVNTLGVLADQAPPSALPLWAILDAQRQELFAAKFNDETSFAIIREWETAIVREDDWLAGLRSGDHVTGPPLKRLASRLPPGVNVLPESSWQPMAAAVGRIAWTAYRAGHRDDIWKLAPNYYRASAAEEKHKAATGGRGKNAAT